MADKFHNVYQFRQPESDDPKVLKRIIGDMATKLNSAMTDISRVSGGGSSVVLIGGSSSSSSGGGSAVSADNIRAGTASIGAAGGTVNFASPLSGYSNVNIWAWLLADGMTVFAEISGITISGFTVGAIPGGLSGTVYYIAVGY